VHGKNIEGGNGEPVFSSADNEAHLADVTASRFLDPTATNVVVILLLVMLLLLLLGFLLKDFQSTKNFSFLFFFQPIIIKPRLLIGD